MALCLGLVAGSSPAADHPKPADPEAVATEVVDTESTRVDIDLIETWVAELNSDSYREREAARRNLLKAPIPVAVGPLLRAANRANLEVSVRAISVFESLLARAEGGDIEVTEDALDTLIASENPATAARAVGMADRVADVREKRAVAKLHELGADVQVNQEGIAIVNGQPVAQAITIVLDPDTWKGGEDGLKYLKRVSRLTRLYLVDDVISDDAGAELALALPNLDIQGRGTAYLGVGGVPVGGVNGCFVQTVKEGTAAADAGIEPGDVIQSFGGKPVAGFAELVDLIKEHRPGDKVVTQVLRNGVDKVDLEVKLGRWADNSVKTSLPDITPGTPRPIPDPSPNRLPE